MAILKNLIVNGGASRFIGTSYFQDVSIAGSAALASLSLSGNLSVTGTSTLSGSTTVGGTLGVTGDATFENITATGTVVFSKTQDLSGTANSSPALIVGGTATSAHMELDANEIHAKATGTTVADLYLNNQGGKVYLSSNSVYAYGNTFIAPTANISTLNATNVNVTNNLRANHYDLQTVAQLGGSFYVSPTVKFPNSGTTLKVEKSGSTLTLTITDSSITSTTMAGVVWSANSRVKVSGTINGVVTGTMDGTISSINTSSHTLTLSVSGENSASVPVGSFTASKFSGLTVMIYYRRDGSNNYRVGIWMNCYDVANSSSTIRIYGGSDANPNVMLGNLTNAGLGTVNNLTPTGWGLFAQNAFLHGKVVANGGLIGNWTIGTTGMYYNSDAPGSTSITMIPDGTAASTTSIGGSSGSKQWIFTGKNLFGIDTDGKLYASSAHISGTLVAGANSKIGPWTVTATSIYKVSDTLGSTTSGAAYFGDLGLSVGDKFKVDASGVAILGESSGYHATMDTDSFDVLNGSTILATFGETATIGNMSTRGISIDSHGFKFNNEGNTVFYIGVDSRAGQQEHLSNYYNISTSSTSQQIDGKKYYLLTSVPSDATVMEVGNSLTSSEGYRYKDWVVNQNKLWLSSEEVDSFEQDTVAYIYTQPTTNTRDPYCVIGESFYTDSKIAGNNSLAQGYGCLATGAYSTAIGWQTIASGMNSLACGLSNEASGRASHAEGSNTSANAQYSHAEGSQTTASGLGSHAEGNQTTASGNYSHAEGNSTIASASYSHAEGWKTTASGIGSHAEGNQTTASEFCSHAAGSQTTASGNYSHAEGDSTTASASYSHAEGSDTTTSGRYSHAEGQNTTASGIGSHAEGVNATASGEDSHAEGSRTTASGTGSHAEGSRTTASGYYSHAEGSTTIAAGWYSHAGGFNTVALHDQQFVIGRYNKATVSGSGTDSDPYTYTDVGDYPFIIGNGSPNIRSNALTVDWSGNVVASGNIACKGVTAPLFKEKYFATGSLSVGANAAIAINYNQLSGYSIPAGYRAIAFSYIGVSNNHLYFSWMNPVSSHNTNIAVCRNSSASTQTFTLGVRIIFALTSLFGT